jgi:AcrR family transcriptional regulator
MSRKSKEENRTILRNVASKLFVKKGFEKTTIRDIAKAADMNSAAIYYYFEDKESLLYAILTDIMDASLGQMKEIANSQIGLKEKIQSIITVHTKTFCSDPITMDLIVHNQKSLTPEHWEELKAKHRAYYKLVARVLDEMKGKKLIKNLDTTACTFALFGMIQWAHRWYNPKGEIKLEQLRDIFAHIFTRGILSDTNNMY